MKFKEIEINNFLSVKKDDSIWKCTGWCGWANTNEYQVRKENNLWND